MIQEEQLLVKEVKNLFQSFKLKQCIISVDNFDKNVSFECHQNLQLYKGYSLLVSIQIQEGFQCFEDIIQESQQKKGGTINEIDVVIRVIYLYEMQYIDMSKAEEQNEHLLRVCEEYRKQNENLETYQKGIYLFAKGLHLFIQNSKSQSKLDCIPYLEEAFELVEDYKQEVMILLGWIFYTKFKIEQSLKWNYKLYDLNKYYPGVINNLTLAEEENKNYEKVESLMKETELLCDNNPVCLHNISLYYQKRGKKEEEKEYIEKMYKFNPKSALACTHYGSYLYKNDKKEEGLKMIKEAIDLDPKYIGSQEQLQAIYYENEDFQSSIIYAQKCLEIHPNNGYYYYKLGENYEGLEQFEEAIQAYTKSEQLPNNPRLQVFSISRAAYCLFRLHNYGESLEQYFRSCNQNDDFDVSNNIINACCLMNSNYPISISKKIELINKLEGSIIMRFEQFECQVEDQRLKYLFLERLDNLRTLISIYSYKKNIQSQLTFQPLISHFDLFVD